MTSVTVTWVLVSSLLMGMIGGFLAMCLGHALARVSDARRDRERLAARETRIAEEMARVRVEEENRRPLVA